jgi:hypothetical protein
LPSGDLGPEPRGVGYHPQGAQRPHAHFTHAIPAPAALTCRWPIRKSPDGHDILCNYSKMSTILSTKHRRDDIDGWYGGWMGLPWCGGRLAVSQLTGAPNPTPKSSRIGTVSAARVAYQFRSLEPPSRLKKSHQDTEVQPSAVATCGWFGWFHLAIRLHPWVHQPWATPLGLHPHPYSHHHRQFKPIDSLL